MAAGEGFLLDSGGKPIGDKDKIVSPNTAQNAKSAREVNSGLKHIYCVYVQDAALRRALDEEKNLHIGEVIRLFPVNCNTLPSGVHLTQVYFFKKDKLYVTATLILVGVPFVMQTEKVPYWFNEATLKKAEILH